MGILGKIGTAIKRVVSAPFVALNNILNALADAGEKMRGDVDIALGLKKRRVPREKIRRALREQYLELLPGEEIAGVEWEGEIYYETPK